MDEKALFALLGALAVAILNGLVSFLINRGKIQVDTLKVKREVSRDKDDRDDKLRDDYFKLLEDFQGLMTEKFKLLEEMANLKLQNTELKKDNMLLLEKIRETKREVKNVEKEKSN